MTVSSSTSKRVSLGTKIFYVFLFVLAIAGSAATYFGTRGVLRAQASVDWPTVQGKIIESSVEREKRRRTSGSKGPRTQTIYRAKISYEYTVDGTTFTGTRIAYGDHGTIANSERIGINGMKFGTGGGNARSHAQGIVDLYPKGKNVSVYYMPENPKECLLEPGLALKAFTWPAVGIVMLIVAGVLACAAYSVARDDAVADQGVEGDG